MNLASSNDFAPILLIGAALISTTFNVIAEEVGPECRGVAAGIVAAMKSSGEISSAEAAQVAIIAARRACTAALEGDLGKSDGSAVHGGPQEQSAASSKSSADDESSMWDFLTRDRSTKDGHDRLRRLKTQ